MSLVYPNIVPENNLRLPDALTIKHGPARLLSRFVLEGDMAARRMGLRLRLRHDFGELLYVNKHYSAQGSWYPLMKMFDPRICDLIPENSYWISGESEQGEIVLTQSGRVYYWPESTLEEEVRLMFYGGRDEGQDCRVTAQAASMITGVVFCGGSHWIHPEFRGRQLSRLLGRLGRAYAVARWPVEWTMALCTTALVEKGVASGYGYRHMSRSVFFPGSPLGDLEAVVAYSSAGEAYEDLAEFLSEELADSKAGVGISMSSSKCLEDSVTSISSDSVLHGSNSRS